MKRKLIAGVLACLIVSAGGVAFGGSTAGAAPTCGGVGGIANHGEHIIGDYVTGLGGIGPDGIAWPPKGQVGQTIGGQGGAVAPGAPSPANHDPFAPGASFCTSSASPGVHL